MIELKGQVVVINVPVEADNSLYLNPVSGNESPLSLLVKRLESIVEKKKIILMTGRESKHAVFNKFTALNEITLFPSNEENELCKLLLAVSIHRVKNCLLISANHTFADPYLLQFLLDNHMKRQPPAGYSVYGNIPEWAAGEVFDIDLLQRGMTRCQEIEAIPPTARDFYDIHADDYFRVNKTGAPLRGRWPEAYSIAEPGGYERIVNAMKRAPNPVELSIKELLG